MELVAGIMGFYPEDVPRAKVVQLIEAQNTVVRLLKESAPPDTRIDEILKEVKEIRTTTIRTSASSKHTLDYVEVLLKRA